MRTISKLALIVLIPLLAAAAPQPVRLQPSSPWVLDYAENSCRLSRAFGTDKDRTVLQFESTAPGEMSMIAMGKPLQTGAQEIPARFLPVQDKAYKGQAEQTTDKRPGVLWAHVSLLPPAMVEQEKTRADWRKAHPRLRPPPRDHREYEAAQQEFASATTELEIETRHGRPVILETGALGEAIKTFGKCNRDSLRDWGIDPDVEDKIVRPAWSPNVLSWFSADDYPGGMQRQGKQSEVRVRLLVDAAGNVTKCTSLSHFDEPEFNRVTCDKFMKRAKFEPAELADGTKVPSYYINRVNWVLRP